MDSVSVQKPVDQSREAKVSSSVAVEWDCSRMESIVPPFDSSN